MPEASVDQDDLFQPREDEVRGAGQVPPAEAEPEAEPVGQSAHGDLRAGVPAADARRKAKEVFAATGRVAPIFRLAGAT